MNEKSTLLKGNITSAILRFAFPLLISIGFQQFYNAADTAIVGNCLGETSLAAVGSCGSIYEFLLQLSMGTGNGFSILTGQFYGAGDREKLKKSVALSFLCGAFITVILMITGKIFLRPLLVLLRTPEEILPEACTYIVTICMGIGVMFAYNLLAAMLQAIGNSTAPLVFLIISSILNIGLDLLFIQSFGMGVFGAALATVIAQLISAVLCAVYIFFQVKLLIPEKKHFAFDSSLCGKLMGQGLSMGFMGAIVSTGSIILQYGINNFGTLTIAGHTAARKLFSISTIPATALARTSAAMASQNRGANQRERILAGMKAIFLMGAVIAAVETAAMPFISRPIIRLISGSAEEEVLSIGSRYMIFTAPFMLTLVPLLSMRNALQGIGRKLTPILSSAIEFFGKILFTVLIIPRMGYNGVILCEPLIWCCMTAELLWACIHDDFLNPKKRKNKDSAEDQK